jgi:hypothetical protein
MRWTWLAALLLVACVGSEEAAPMAQAGTTTTKGVTAAISSTVQTTAAIAPAKPPRAWIGRRWMRTKLNRGTYCWGLRCVDKFSTAGAVRLAALNYTNLHVWLGFRPTKLTVWHRERNRMRHLKPRRRFTIPVRDCSTGTYAISAEKGKKGDVSYHFHLRVIYGGDTGLSCG